MEYWVYVHNDGGYTMGTFIRPYSEENWGTITITHPYNGNNSRCRDYCIKDRKFQGILVKKYISDIGESFIITEQTHPEYFI